MSGGGPGGAGLVDAHVPRLAACLGDGHELVRRQALALLAHLLQKALPPPPPPPLFLPLLPLLPAPSSSSYAIRLPPGVCLWFAESLLWASCTPSPHIIHSLPIMILPIMVLDELFLAGSGRRSSCLSPGL